jgi:hypothetical protein
MDNLKGRWGLTSTTAAVVLKLGFGESRRTGVLPNLPPPHCKPSANIQAGHLENTTSVEDLQLELGRQVYKLRPW